ncbi:hypothetical protein Tco_0554280 [Tanacetum coccineum]
MVQTRNPRTLVAAEVVAFGGGDDGEEMVMMALGGVGWQQWWYKWSGEAAAVMVVTVGWCRKEKEIRRSLERENGKFTCKWKKFTNESTPSPSLERDSLGPFSSRSLNLIPYVLSFLCHLANLVSCPSWLIICIIFESCYNLPDKLDILKEDLVYQEFVRIVFIFDLELS